MKNKKFLATTAIVLIGASNAFSLPVLGNFLEKRAALSELKTQVSDALRVSNVDETCQAGAVEYLPRAEPHNPINAVAKIAIDWTNQASGEERKSHIRVYQLESSKRSDLDDVIGKVNTHINKLCKGTKQ